MVSKSNRPWNLESFLNSLIFELDKAQDTLSLKGLNRKLTYTVKDVALDLQIFPEYDGDTVRFTTAKPGETGASKVSLQLGSIRDHQIKEITKKPLTKEDISIEETDLSETARKEFQRLGITSAEDLRRTVEDHKVNLEKLTKEKIDYENLADIINQSRRRRQAPRVAKVSVAKSMPGKVILTLVGDNLAIASSFADFPVAVINDQTVEIVSANENELRIQVNEDQIQGTSKQLKVALDPYAIVTMKLKQ
ncbi:MAG TPA: hypothetical protein DCF68_18665 [Cyanothece sp. UBA12306]|nr:hypothetical protein [Cyanothece sp. UBA12306]